MIFNRTNILPTSSANGETSRGQSRLIVSHFVSTRSHPIAIIFSQTHCKRTVTLTAWITEYKAAAALDPNNFWNHSHIGEILREKGELDAAIKEQEEMLRLDPKSVWALHYLARSARQG